MKHLLDTDHITIWRSASGSAFAALSARSALHSPADFAVSAVSFHEQFLGVHAFLAKGRTTAAVVRGMRCYNDY